MYEDAKAELKRLEEALLEEDMQPEEAVEAEKAFDFEAALSDIPDLPVEKKANSLTVWLTVAVIMMTGGILAVLIIWLIRYGSVFL